MQSEAFHTCAPFPRFSVPRFHCVGSRRSALGAPFPRFPVSPIHRFSVSPCPSVPQNEQVNVGNHGSPITHHVDRQSAIEKRQSAIRSIKPQRPPLFSSSPRQFAIRNPQFAMELVSSQSSRSRPPHVSRFTGSFCNQQSQIGNVLLAAFCLLPSALSSPHVSRFAGSFRIPHSEFEGTLHLEPSPFVIRNRETPRFPGSPSHVSRLSSLGPWRPVSPFPPVPLSLRMSKSKWAPAFSVISFASALRPPLRMYVSAAFGALSGIQIRNSQSEIRNDE